MTKEFMWKQFKSQTHACIKRNSSISLSFTESGDNVDILEISGSGDNLIFLKYQAYATH